MPCYIEWEKVGESVSYQSAFFTELTNPVFSLWLWVFNEQFNIAGSECNEILSTCDEWMLDFFYAV